MTAMVGVMFGLPSLRIKGFYLAVATLAAQFFLVWLFNKVPWFYNYSASGQINAPERFLFGHRRDRAECGALGEIPLLLVFVFVLAWVARNLTRGSLGRQWMAIRDMDIAAEIIGVNPLRPSCRPLRCRPSTWASRARCSSPSTWARSRWARPTASRSRSWCCS
jgi:branched-chain amino acid transport system permease protein